MFHESEIQSGALNAPMKKLMQKYEETYWSKWLVSVKIEESRISDAELT